MKKIFLLSISLLLLVFLSKSQDCFISALVNETGAPYEIQLIGAPSDPDLEGTYMWDFGSEGTKFGKEVTHTFPQAGIFVIAVHFATLDSSCVTFDSVLVDVAEPICDILPTATSTGNLYEYELEAFHSNVMEGGSYSWNLLELGSVNGNPAIFTFPGPGDYLLAAHFANTDSSCVTFDSLLVQVPEPVCDVRASWTPTGTAFEYEFTANHTTTGFDGYYVWGFSEGAKSGKTVTQNFGQPGLQIFFIHFTSFDSTCSAFDSVVVDVPEAPCNVQISFSPTQNTYEYILTASHQGGVAPGSYEWFPGGAGPIYGDSLVHTFGSSGIQFIDLYFTSFDSTCSIRDSIEIDIPAPNCDVTFTKTLEDNKLTASATNLGDQFGAYFWNFGDGNVGYGKEVEHVYAATGAYNVRVDLIPPDSVCFAAAIDTLEVLTLTTPTYQLGGTVTAGGTNLDLGKVSLFRLDDNTWIQAVNQVISNTYSFSGLEAGAYLIHAIPDPSSIFAETYEATYYQNASLYQDGTIINLSGDNLGLNIALNTVTDQTTDPTWNTGTEIIYGYVILGPNVAQKGENGSSTTSLDENDIPLQNAIVTLYNDAGERLAFTTTDEFGAYSFENLVAGDYTLIIEYAGILDEIPTEVTLDGNALTSDGEVQFEVEQTSVITSFDQPSEQEIGLHLFPNPSSGEVFIQTEASVSELKVISTKGNEVLRRKDTKSFSVRDLTAGYYQVVLIPEDGEVQSLPLHVR